MEGSLAKELYGDSLQLSTIELGPASIINKQSDSGEDNLKYGDEPLWGEASDEEADKTFELDREWQRRHDQFHAIGYRDGLTAGKEASAQEGFNIGFKQSVIVGYNWGLVRGVSSAVAWLPDGLKEKLIERREKQNKFQDLYESVHSVSTSDALKLFHNDVATNKLAEQKGNADSTTHAESLQQQNPKYSHLEDYHEELKLLTESTVIEVHSMVDP